MSGLSLQAAPSPDGYDLELNALTEYAPAPPPPMSPEEAAMLGVCYKTSNNKYPDCPALMDDGRSFTDYRPSCYVNDLIRVKNGLKSSYQYRQFLIHNGVKLMDTIRLYNLKKNGCRPCDAVPVQCETLCSTDHQAVSCKPHDCRGIGRCYQYTPMAQYDVNAHMGVPKSWCDLGAGAAGGASYVNSMGGQQLRYHGN
jgi:hypothetical protein